MRWMAYGMALLFGFAAAVQFNDPDPLRWILAYGLAAGLSLYAGRGHFVFRVNAAAALLFGVGFAAFASSLVGADPAAFQSIEMKAPEHELPREAIGLGLCTGWFALLAGYARRSARSEAAARRP